MTTVNMKWGVSLPALVPVVLCCLFQSGFSQDPTDINRGCYFDRRDRALTDLITCEDGRETCHASCGMAHRYCQSEDRMTIDLCRELCRVRNLRYYALEAGTQCFCGGALSDPFQHGNASGNEFNCSYPCTGNVNQTCGGEFKMQVYEFQDPVPGADCFHPGFVPKAFISANVVIATGEEVNFICEPYHKIVGEAQVACQSKSVYSPNVLPVCNYTGILEGSTIELPTTSQESTTLQTTTAAQPLTTITRPTTELPTTSQESTTLQTTTAAQPVTTITDLLPYIIGGSAALLFLLVLCMVCIFVCKRRKRSGNSGQDISLKPDPAPVTFLNQGFHLEEAEEAKVDMPDILSDARNMSSPPPPSNLHRMSTFAEDPVYQNGNSSGAIVYANVNEMKDPPSPIYANAAKVLPDDAATPNDEHPGYTKRYSGTSGSATTDRFNVKRGSSSNDPVAVYATENRSRAKKNATGTKDLVGWSRPSSLYQRTALDDEDTESIEDNTAVNPNDLSGAIYAQIDKSLRSDSRETLTSEHSGNSFFADPAKSSATRL